MIDCFGVTAMLALGRRVIKTQATLETIMHTACTLFNVQDETVCKGVANTFGPPLFYILSQSKLSSREMAAILLGSKACAFSAHEFTTSQLNWSIEVPAKPEKKRDTVSVG